MSELTPREAVYLLARSQNAWIPAGGGLASPDGFDDGVDAHGRQLRWVSCPDCLANDRPRFGCESCGGRGEIPDASPDPMRVRAVGPVAFFGHQSHERHDRTRALDAQILRLQITTNQREGHADPEDRLERSRRLHEAQLRTGDYRLLEAGQERLGWASIGRHLLWLRVVVDGLAYAPSMRAQLDGVADWLADWMLGAIAAHRLEQHLAQARLGIRRPRLRPDRIIVPVPLLAAAEQAGKGRWANAAAQGQRDALVVAMHHEGRTAGEIARRVGLTKRRVQQLLAGVELGEVATGPAA